MVVLPTVRPQQCFTTHVLGPVRRCWLSDPPAHPLAQAAPSAAITFAAYDAVLAWLLLVTGEEGRKRQQQQSQQQQGAGAQKAAGG